jgi:hypothetical protein
MMTPLKQENAKTVQENLRFLIVTQEISMPLANFCSNILFLPLFHEVVMIVPRQGSSYWHHSICRDKALVIGIKSIYGE